MIKELTKNPGGYFKYEMLPSERIQLTKISEVDPWLKTLKLSKDKNELVIIENIYYPSGSFQILPEAEGVLGKAIEALKAFQQNKFADIAYCEPFYLKEFYNPSKA